MSRIKVEASVIVARVSVMMSRLEVEAYVLVVRVTEVTSLEVEASVIW